MYYMIDFIRFHGKHHPKDMGIEESRAYLSHLATEGNVVSSTQNVALSALLFLYRQVQKANLPGIENIQRARRSRRVPVVFTRNQAFTSTPASIPSIPCVTALLPICLTRAMTSAPFSNFSGARIGITTAAPVATNPRAALRGPLPRSSPPTLRGACAARAQ